MPSAERRGKRWRALAWHKGTRLSVGTFTTKAEAIAAAALAERQAKAGHVANDERRTLEDVLDRYSREVTPKKRGAAWEGRRLLFLAREPIAKVRLSELTTAVLAQWRDDRLKAVSGSTVTRDFNLLSHALTIARKEWGWIDKNPASDVSRPRENPHRERIATDQEIAALCLAAGYRVGQPATTATARAAAAFCFSVETAMRAGEILGLTPASVIGAVARLPMTKNGDPRDVPLSARALQILADVGGEFGLTDPQRDALWRKVRDRARIEGLTFHDARATAITRLSARLDPLQLARMVGHRNINELLGVIKLNRRRRQSNS